MKRLFWIAMVVLAGCDAPTRGEVYNTFEDDTVVYKVWYQTTFFPDPLLPGERSQQERLVPSKDFAYALLAPGWDPASGAGPAMLIPVRSSNQQSVERDGVLVLELSAKNVTGDCGHGATLSQEDADFITQRIFPGPFAGLTYNAKTCTVTPVP